MKPEDLGADAKACAATEGTQEMGQDMERERGNLMDRPVCKGEENTG